MLVATGRAEIMIDPVMNVWDAAALQPILEEAGGTFTDWSGEPTIHHNEGIAIMANCLRPSWRSLPGGLIAQANRHGDLA